jgi:putative oxidoreductase
LDFISQAPKGALPIQNVCELAVRYCFLFLYLAARGDGAWSVGELIGTRTGFTRRVRNLI